MAHLSTGGLQDIHRSEGSGRGCSLSERERARLVALRPRQWVEARVFCLHCAWSWAVTDAPGDAVGDHLAGHPAAGAACGQDWALGHRYGPLTGQRLGGRLKTLPPIEKRRGRPRSAESAQRGAAAGGTATRRKWARHRKAAGNAAAGAAVE